MKWLDLHTKLNSCQPPTLIGLYEVNLLKTFLLGITLCLHVCLPYISHAVGSIKKIFSTGNCMKYQDLHGKVIFADPTVLMGDVDRGQGSYLQKCFAINRMKSPDLLSRQVCQPTIPYWSGRWGINFPLEIFCKKWNKMSISAQKNVCQPHSLLE